MAERARAPGGQGACNASIGCARRRNSGSASAHEVIMTPKPLVLCPVDFSEACSGALRYSAAIAEHFHSDLVIATVNDPLLDDTAAMISGEGHLAKETARDL